ncbi:MAG: PEP-CTERM sorting domain-containing protein [Gammaproteobacteria bacterium]|nr:PEP-CTERM sorting domain-containing protein [Gammaproteobacteria bacterium]
MKKTLLAAALLAVGGSATAAPFYMDIGSNFDGQIAPAGDKVCDTCTSVKDELTFAYDSTTTIIDNDISGTINAGDTIITDGGLAVGGLATNQVTGFLPAEVFGANSDNGYGSSNDWVMSFSITGLAGVVTGVSGGVPQFAYGPGLIELFVTFDGLSFNNFMDINVTGGGATGVSTILTGTADFTAVDAGFNDLFHSGTYDCLGDDSFFGIWSNCGQGAGEMLTINFFASFDTNIFVSDFTDNGDGTFSLTSNHDGSATFAVPEPSTLALLGGSMLLLGGMARRNKKS